MLCENGLQYSPTTQLYNKLLKIRTLGKLGTLTHYGFYRLHILGFSRYFDTYTNINRFPNKYFSLPIIRVTFTQHLPIVTFLRFSSYATRKTIKF